ncbi:MAG: acyl-CoA synthetase [Solirubrobacteraceae bacterium]
MTAGVRQGGQRVWHGIATGVVDWAFTLRTLLATGVVGLDRPDRAYRALAALRRWGATPAAGYAVQSARTPERIAIYDELGPLTFAEVEARTNAIARGLRASGVGEGDGVAVLSRNHRGFIEATVAASKLGANAICMNTGFAGPQIAEVCKREGLGTLVYDEEFSDTVREAAACMTCFLSWRDSMTHEHPALEDLAGRYPRGSLKPPSVSGRVVILTSGTTGLPKGAARETPDTIATFAPIFSRIPLRARRSTLIAAPLFHTWGFGHFAWGLTLGSSIVLQRRFDPEQTLAAVERHRAHTLVVVPVMLKRILDLSPEIIARYDTRSLRVIAVSGSALPGELALGVMDAFGEVLYNLYGSTEVAWASVASPAELRAAPGTAGTPPRGTVVRIYDQDGNEVSHGETGRIFVGNELMFDGYTGGGTKASIDGLMSTGDLGYFDEAGRLFVAGRDDEMIVSGGENVFPREIEDVLADHEAVKEVAVIGVADEQFGQRLRAFVVLHADKTVTEDALQDHVRENLARFKVPREIVFTDQLPRNAAGKVLKRELQTLEVPVR